MSLSALNLAAVANADLPRRWWVNVDAVQWQTAARQVASSGGRLVALWGSDPRPTQPHFWAHAAYADPQGLFWLRLAVDSIDPIYPDLAGIFPSATRPQRAVRDLLGLIAAGAEDTRPWLRHAHWPADYFPLRQEASSQDVFAADPEWTYPFVEVSGDGVHEIPVGPVHAGIIEPGHFRFSVVGERILRLEAQLGYTHRGIDQRFRTLAPLEAYRLAGRVAGDSTVAYAWAYCQALETATGQVIPERAAWLRALALERERVANHLGDLGALGNDAALAFGLTQFSRLREDWQRLSGTLFGHRLMMDWIVPGGVSSDLEATACDQLQRQCDVIEIEVQRLRAVYRQHAGLQDRFISTGRVSSKLAAQLGLSGLAGRASGQTVDLRHDHPCLPYTLLEVKKSLRRRGDIAARVGVRFDEIQESLRLIRELSTRLPGGAIRETLVIKPEAAQGAGWIESWRGEVFVALELTAAGCIQSCHCHDPSWSNWPVLEHAVMDNIVPDFPLINKSFNLSYAGHDR